MKVVQSNGLGVESMTIITEWIENPDSRDFPLEALIVMTMQTGDEHEDSIRLNQTHLLPLLRKHKIRFVELARAGHLEEDGIVVLQDTRNPFQLHREGVFKLSDELKLAGTLPQFAGEHICSLKFKGWVGEQWLAQEFKDEPYRHVFGYNSDEQPRIIKSETAIAERKAKYRIAFGFNSEEQSRIAKAEKYDTAERFAEYPLDVWGWNRAYCEAYLFAIYGEPWEKSACVFCPFNGQVYKETPRGLSRLVSHKRGAVEALLLERMSLSLNPRGQLYRNSALIDIIHRRLDDARFSELLACYDAELAKTDWALYRVRRKYTKKGKAARAVERLQVGSQAEMLDRLAPIAGERVERRDIQYVYQLHRGSVYPAYEEFHTVGPALVNDKTRYGFDHFNERWNPDEINPNGQFSLFM